MSPRILLIILILTKAVFSQETDVEPGVSHDLAIWRAAHYSDVRYKLNLTLEKMSPVLKGTIEIHVKVGVGTLLSTSTQSGETAPIILDWRKVVGHEKDSTISNVTINGKAVVLNNALLDVDIMPKYVELSEHLMFGDGVVLGENIIKLDFTSPILTSGSAITRYVDKEDGAEYIYSLFVPSDASTAFPVFDQPDLKARFNLSAQLPKDWSIISNGQLFARVVQIPDSINPVHDYADYIFIETKPISTYVFAFAAGPFERMSDSNAAVPAAVPVASGRRTEDGEPGAGRTRDSQRDAGVTTNIFVRKSQAAKFKPHASEVFRLTREGVKYLETYFDYKFPFPKYDLVLIPEFPFGGMEHAGATFLRESSVIFPTEPTKSDYISRANLIFHETAHQWFGDTVTMKWFDDLWLKEGFAEFMAYKTLEKVMPEANAWKVFYERNKQAAYLTDSTKGTTPIYQEIANLSAAKSAYGNIVYRKAPSFLRQAEFYLGPDKFQTSVRAFLKKHEYANAGWEDLVKEFETASNSNLTYWANGWVTKRGMPIFRMKIESQSKIIDMRNRSPKETYLIFSQNDVLGGQNQWIEKLQLFYVYESGKRRTEELTFNKGDKELEEYWGTDLKGFASKETVTDLRPPEFIFPNYGDYGYGIFLLDNKSRDYVLKNIQNEKDDFLRTMMWGSLWDSVRAGELDPKVYVELVVKNLATEQDESTIQSLLSRVSTAMNYYISYGNAAVPAAVGVASRRPEETDGRAGRTPDSQRDAGGSALNARLEALLVDRMQNAATPGQRITFYRAFLNIASTENARAVLKKMVTTGGNASVNERASLTSPTMARPLTLAFLPLRTKDRFDIVTRLMILGDAEAPKLLADLERTETGDDAKRYAYAAKAGVATADSKTKFWSDYTANKDISESWIEASLGSFNSTKHANLTLPYLEKALAELPNLKRNRKIFFVNGWLAAFIGGQRSEEALKIANKFLADNPNLDKDLRLKVLENVDLIERAVKIRGKYGKS